jgi:hypothetical protein
MSPLSVIATAAVLSGLAASPVFAQAAGRSEVFRNPGLNAFYSPNSDVLNGGKPTPASKLASDPAAMQAYAARESGVGTPSAPQSLSIKLDRAIASVSPSELKALRRPHSGAARTPK